MLKIINLRTIVINAFWTGWLLVFLSACTGMKAVSLVPLTKEDMLKGGAKWTGRLIDEDFPRRSDTPDAALRRIVSSQARAWLVKNKKCLLMRTVTTYGGPYIRCTPMSVRGGLDGIMAGIRSKEMGDGEYKDWNGVFDEMFVLVGQDKRFKILAKEIRQGDIEASLKNGSIRPGDVIIIGGLNGYL